MSLVQGIALFAVLALLAAAGVTVAHFRREAESRRNIERTLREIGHDRLCNLVVPDGTDGQIQIEHLLLTAHGFVVIDIKDLAGSVFAAENMDEWTVLDGTRRTTIRNPLHALQDRINAVRTLVSGEVPVRGWIVFTQKAEFPKSSPDGVTKLEKLGELFPRSDGPGEMRAVEAFYPRWEKLRILAQS